MSATGFTTQWLESRYPFDEKARSSTLTEKFVQHLHKKEKVSLVDLGAGIGSNVKYLCDRIKAHQDWYLIEIDPDLIMFGLQSLENFFGHQGYQVHQKNHSLQVRNEFTLRITFLQDSIFNINRNQFRLFDGIVSNALLDVLTVKQLDSLFFDLSHNNAPKLFSIIYQNMEWLDEDIENSFFVEKYHQHMQRAQLDGPALGADCVPAIMKKVREAQEVMIFEDSNWKVNPSDKILLNHLLRFYKTSIPETSGDPEFIKRFDRWFSQKSELVSKGRLGAKVFHQDVLWADQAPS